MSRAIRKSAFFLGDLETQFRWYEEEAGWEVAWRYLLAVDQTLARLAEHSDLGRTRHFSHPELQGLRSFLVARPFHRHLIFYRQDDRNLYAVRVMHGARDLPRRLRQPPGTEGE
jgi:toxin ParE1/3/4